MLKNPSSRHGITVRGDSLYCPLPLSVEPYWWCSPNCYHCYFRGLNHIWGKEYRPLNLEALDRKLKNGLNNKTPKSVLAHCLSRKKTIRLGNKSDPFQPIELKLKISTKALGIFRKYNWTFVIQTRFPKNALVLAHDSIEKAHHQGLVTLLPVMSPGLERDWEVFERKRTDSIPERLKVMKWAVKKRIPIGVQGEPFIPGFHEVKDFEDTLKLLRDIGIHRYNTYNFHFTPFVAKRIANLPGVDIEKIWRLNQDRYWKPILQNLINLAEKYNFILGCPDFVNSGRGHKERANTCCGIDVPNPTTFNTHYFKAAAQSGLSSEEIEVQTWDGSGNLEQGRKIIKGDPGDFYTLRDAGLVENGRHD